MTNDGIFLRDIDNIVLKWLQTSNCYYLVGRHISGCLVGMVISRYGIPQRPLKFIEGRLPVLSEQSQDTREEGGLQNDFLIDFYPFNPMAKGYFDAREGGTTNSVTDDDLLIEEIPPILKNQIDKTMIFADFETIDPTTQRQGVEVSDGKPSLVEDDQGGLFLFFSYNKNFRGRGKTSDCSPFIGRVYCMYSADLGSNWTPPICVFNLSPFNPSVECLSKNFPDMISYFDAGFNQGTDSKPDFSAETKGLKNINYLSDFLTNEIVLEDFDIFWYPKTSDFILSFWFGGFICYSKIGHNVELLKTIWNHPGTKSRQDDFGRRRYAYEHEIWSSFYNQKIPNTRFYYYTRFFWEPLEISEIFIVAGPVERILEFNKTNAPTPKPGDESPAATLLKAYSGKKAREDSVKVKYPDPQKSKLETYNRFYNPDWEAVEPPFVHVKFGNREYAIDQNKQKPTLNIHRDGNLITCFYSSQNSISFCPINLENVGVEENFPNTLILL